MAAMAAGQAGEKKRERPPRKKAAAKKAAAAEKEAAEQAAAMSAATIAAPLKDPASGAADDKWQATPLNPAASRFIPTPPMNDVMPRSRVPVAPVPVPVAPVVAVRAAPVAAVAPSQTPPPRPVMPV